MTICTSIGGHWTTKACCVILNLHVSVWMSGVVSSAALLLSRGLHGLKTEARTRPVPEIIWPNPTRAAQLNLEPEPDPKSPPPTANSQQKKKKEKGCISRLHAKKRINQGSAISQTFTSYESLWTSGAAVAYILCRVYEFCMDKTIILPPYKLWSFFVS